MESIHPLRAYRDKAAITQLQLAELLGVRRETIARWETGDRKVDDNLLSGVSEKTGIPKNELRPDLAKLMGEAAE